MLRHRLQLHHLLDANVERFAQQLEHFGRNANARLIEVLVQDLQFVYVQRMNVIAITLQHVEVERQRTTFTSCCSRQCYTSSRHFGAETVV